MVKYKTDKKLIKKFKKTMSKLPSLRGGMGKNTRRSVAKRFRKPHMAIGPCTTEYLKSLIDPFENTGCKLGWGTLVPTTLSQAYLRGTVTADAGGNAQLIAFPSVVGIVAAWGGVTNAVANGTQANALDQASVTSQFTGGRIISIGLKSWPNLALTSAPGVLYQGAGVFQGQDITATITAADLQAFPTTVVTKGVEGGTVTGRPVDPKSFQFDETVTNTKGWMQYIAAEDAAGAALDSLIPFSLPYQCYTGIGNGTLVNYEVVVNFEGVTALHHSSTSAISGQPSQTTALVSSEWPSIEAMWNGVKGYLPTPAIAGIDSVASIAAGIGGIGSKVGGNLLSGVGYAAKQFGKQAAFYGLSQYGVPAVQNLMGYAASAVPMLL